MSKHHGYRSDVIYVENLRAQLGCTTDWAKTVLEIDVSLGILERHSRLKCPGCSRLLSPVEGDIVSCDVCEMNEEQEYTFRSSDCDVVEYYTSIEHSPKT